MTAFVNHFLFEFKTGIRNKSLLLMNYLFPFGFYVMLGLLMTGIAPFYREGMVSSMVTFAIMAATLLGLPDPLVTAREAGIFRNYKINGIPARSILMIPVLTTIFHLLIIAVVITGTAPLFFAAPLPVNWPVFFLIFVLTAFACSGLGVLIGVISSSSRMTVLWSQIIFVPSMMLGGLVMPLEMLPEVMRRIAQLLPAAHAINAFRGLTQQLGVDFSPIASMLILLTGGLIAFALAHYLFSWDQRNPATKQRYLAILALLPYLIGVFVLS